MAGAGVQGPGQRATSALAVALLWLVLLLPLHAVPSCGKPKFTGRILGGKNAPEQRWPWQASLLYRGRHICGATLIDAFWVISAAHCFQKSRTPSDYYVLLGYQELQHPTEHSVQMTVNQVLIHEDFNKHYFQGSDIALLQLHRAVNFTSYVLPACLVEPYAEQTYHSCWITGWGMVTEQEHLAEPFHLQEGEVSLMDSEVCTQFFQELGSNSRRFFVHKDMLCAGDLVKGKSICPGDSGGPLVCKVKRFWYLVGVSSWSAPCHEPVGPSVFTRVSHFSSWIREMQRTSPKPDPALAPPQSQPPAVSEVNPLGAAPKPRTRPTLVHSQICLLLLLSLGAL